MAYAESVKQSSDKGDGEPTTARYIDAIDRYERGTSEWKERCEKINKIYLDQHRTQASARRFAMLWSNIETLKPATYARLPIAVVSRRFKDADPIGRKTGEVLERCINTTFDLGGVDEVLLSVRDDRLLTSRGQAWVRYEAQFEAPPPAKKSNAAASDSGSANGGDAAGSDSAPGQPAAKPHPGKLKSEAVCIEFVHWSDFGHTLNRTWPEVTAVWRRVYMTKDKVTKRWDEARADKLNYEIRPEYAQKYGPDVKDATEPQAVIYEIWDKDRKLACWLAKDEKITLESGDPPLNFRSFFPCPKPAYGTRSTASLIPTPDYRYYQDQAEEINDLTEKIAALQEWLVLKAFIPAGPSSEGGDAIINMLQALQERCMSKGIFVPVESWAGFAEKGGSKQIDWLPMDMVIGTIKAAIECRQQLIQDVYQITGISDILRGETDPNETLGAQQIKAQTGSRRIQTCQRDLARFARDLAEMAGEVISEVFQPDTIAAMSGFDMTQEAPAQLLMQARALTAQIQPPMMPMAPTAASPGGGGASPGTPPPNPQVQQQLQQIQQQLQQINENKQVLALLRDERTRGYRIEIETDSTIEPDESAEKQRRMEFLEATGGFFAQAMPVLQLMPSAAPLIGQMLLFMVRGFRAGRELEDTVEQTMQQVMQASQQPKPADPAIAKAQAQQQADAERHQQTMQQADQQHQQTMQIKQAEGQQKITQGELTLQQLREKHAAEMHNMAAQHQMAQEQAATTNEHEQQKHQQAIAETTHKHGLEQEAATEKTTKAIAPTAGMMKQLSDEITQLMQGLHQRIAEIEAQSSAPIEIVHDPKTRRAVKVKRGKHEIPINRSVIH